ncbi:MAG: flagellar biosynthetic protein FliQ [Myxococcota bacterium]|jgi:type III secretion HrpO family protein|nr:EscS/YscS/HrcS family type III secretion system export apparatus protein [Myxococcales bacterium]MBF94981.1 EscS/YscS/HrcS family type III secretion system export apparatus protein [Myxococcales bacterium]MEC7750058.1 flagellar biosynthetic protein FliQ [Myxococcota bacterium]HBU47718.1 EscS/YscS/HrcS family type III secretion system export apparatus protein [Myxococcales bacterium]|tara:strand:- start:175 stop:456 length:282 start_codon:yes stop_codon:yes gene_type:complete
MGGTAIEQFVLQVTNEALVLTLIASAPAVVGSLIVGLAMALFSATTQVQEQTLSFVPKVIAVFIILAVTGPWVGAFLLRFAQLCFTGFVPLLR